MMEDMRYTCIPPTILRPTLKELYERITEGTLTTETAHGELLETLGPWTETTAKQVGRRVSGHGGSGEEAANDIRLAVWKAVSRIDWKRPETFPTFLVMSVSGAALEFNRREDALTRRDRHAVQAYREAEAMFVAVHCRAPSTSEQDELAKNTLGRRRHLKTAVCAPLHDKPQVPIDQIPSTEDVAVTVLDSVTTEMVTAWLQTLPDALRTEVIRWVEKQKQVMPASLRVQIDPYLADLNVDLVRS